MVSAIPAELEVMEPGLLATVQDLGRPGLAGIGVGASGAADRTSFRLANRLVGNPEDAAAVEVTFGGFAARARRDLVVAVTGAPCPVTVGDRQGAVNSVLFVRAGECLRLGRPERGLRSYVAVRGGLAVERVLGSASTDVLSGVGPPRESATCRRSESRACRCRTSASHPCHRCPRTNWCCGWCQGRGPTGSPTTH